MPDSQRRRRRPSIFLKSPIACAASYSGVAVLFSKLRRSRDGNLEASLIAFVARREAVIAFVVCGGAASVSVLVRN